MRTNLLMKVSFGSTIREIVKVFYHLNIVKAGVLRGFLVTVGIFQNVFIKLCLEATAFLKLLGEVVCPYLLFPLFVEEILLFGATINV